MGFLDHWSEPDHIGFIAGQPGIWRQMVFPYLARGLARQERCLYLTSLHTPSLIHALLELEGVDVEDARAQGQFAVLDAAQAYMPLGRFDPDQVIARWREAILETLGQGFAGLRVVADMAWASQRPEGWERLEEYERRVGGELFGLYPLKAICFYDSRFLDGDLLGLVSRTHALVVGDAGGPAPAPRPVQAGLELGR